ncbi:MAG: type II toxin-antitoxin system RelE/ParE family toxin [Candidatus Omnitrophica bacterium]|nr:type II toxin-antitoxin system RelE/ParE family toxin [Candidatus Omnitrophota bacterium]
MNYDIRYPTPRLKRYFDEFLQKRIHHKNQRKKIVDEVGALRGNPRPFHKPEGDGLASDSQSHKKGFTEIKPPIPVSYHLAEYRLKIGDYRVLYNVDDKQKIVWILDIRLRAEKTYRG